MSETPNPFRPPEHYAIQDTATRLPMLSYVRVGITSLVTMILAALVVSSIHGLLRSFPVSAPLGFALAPPLVLLVPVITWLVGRRDWARQKRIHAARIALQEERQELLDRYVDRGKSK